MGLTPTSGGDVGGGPTGGRDLRYLPPKHGHTIHCVQAHYRPVSGGVATPG